MSVCRHITIVGGGLAGLTLGIGLRQRGVPVTIWEAGHYPRHRVCGEFVSGRGQEVLAGLGLRELFTQADATLSSTAQFHIGSAASPVRPVDPPALCLSRFKMDHLLAKTFCSAGGELREHARWQGEKKQMGLVFANGRHLQPVANGFRWFGLKVHARGIQLEADLEMHGSANAYVGLCRLPRNEVNVCGLFRAPAGEDEPEHQEVRRLTSPSLAQKSEVSRPAVGSISRELLRGPPGTLLRERLENAVFDETSFCAVAGLQLRPQRAAEQLECRLGDALTMIPPVTGNGMSMAFESAAMAIAPICAYSHGEISWDTARGNVARACDRVFRTRLFWARFLQSLMLCQSTQGRFGYWILNSNLLWRLLFSKTR